MQALKFFRGRKRFEFLRLYWTSRVNYPSREEALFYMGRAWSVFRPWALELGRRLVEIGTLARPDDVFYLNSAELQAAVDNSALPELKDQAAAQRNLRALRFRMAPPSAIPPLKKDSDPYASLRNNDGEQRVLRGFAVSPGTVTGVASVIMTPDDFDRMKPDSILVCPPDDTGLDAVVSPRHRTRHRHREHSRARLHRCPRVRHSGGAGRGGCHAAHQDRAANPCRRGSGDAHAARLGERSLPRQWVTSKTCVPFDPFFR